jgi:FAD/FMN-containing dehydrogenase
MKPTHKKMLSEEIKQFFKGEITTDAKQLESFSQDASIFKITPEIIVSPRDVIDLKNLVMFASNEKKKRRSLSLTARSGGTDMTGGPLTKSIVVDFTKHFNVIEDSNEKTITTQPGVYYRDIEKINDERGVMIPSYPASKSICTIGGMVNNNSGGEKTLAYGKTENYVDSMKAVFSDGNEYEVKPLNRSQLEEKNEPPNV